LRSRIPPPKDWPLFATAYFAWQGLMRVTSRGCR
jgi:hypothetical protein